VIFALLFAVVGVLSFNIILILLAIFVYGAATTESKTVLLDELLEGITVGDIMTRDPRTVAREATVSELVTHMMRDRQMIYPVTDEAGETIGVVTLNDLKGVKEGDRDSTHVGEIMRDIPRVAPSADAFETLALLNQARSTTALVAEDNRVLGTVSESDFAHVFNMQRGFQSGLTN
jgi:CBS domain-containing protein